jgi:hypothetical protein
MTCTATSSTSSCTTTDSLTPEVMDFIVRGDTLAFKYTFKTRDDDPISVVGATMTYWMKLDVHSPDGEPGDLIDSVVFPDTEDSENGLGYQNVLPVKTEALTSCKTFNYRFTLTLSSSQVHVMGLGRVQVIE